MPIAIIRPKIGIHECEPQVKPLFVTRASNRLEALGWLAEPHSSSHVDGPFGYERDGFGGSRASVASMRLHPEALRICGKPAALEPARHIRLAVGELRRFGGPAKGDPRVVRSCAP